MRTAIVTDSTCDLPKEALERYRITVLPLHITKGGQSFLDGVEITPADIFAHVAGGGEICATSAVNVFEFAACFRTLGQSCDAVVCVTIGAEFSTCYQNACLAADLAGERSHCGPSPADEAPLAAARRVLEQDGRFSQIWETCSGCTVACHCGPNTIGVMFLRREGSASERSGAE